MAKVALVWELGRGFGHINSLVEFARRLQARGHQIIGLMKDVFRSDQLLFPYGIPVIPAPVMARPAQPPHGTVNFAEILIGLGFIIPGALSSQLRAWRHLFELVEAETLIMNYSPSAQLAARGLPLNVINFGTGFEVVPSLSPMPSLMPWQEVPPERIHSSEKVVLRSVNQALQELGQDRLETLGDMQQSDLEILTTFRELDHHGGRPATRYWGPLQDNREGADPEWPAPGGGRYRVFCYLKLGHPIVDTVIAALRDLEVDALIFATGLSDSRAKELSGPNVRVTRQPVQLQSACSDADLVICHSGHGTISTSLLNGAPLALVPEGHNLEQIINAYNVERLGAGKMLREEIAETIPEQIQVLLDQSSYREAARAFADKYAGFNPEHSWAEIEELSEQLITAGTSER